MLYNIMGNRWCGHIGRPHKSNGIFIIADLQAGTTCLAAMALMVVS